MLSNSALTPVSFHCIFTAKFWRSLWSLGFACFTLFIASGLSSGQDANMESKWPTLELQTPDPELVDEIYDYRLQFAVPSQSRFVLEEYSMDWELLNTYDHGTRESAEAQKDFLETRMMLYYDIVEVKLPQTWWDYGIYDQRGDALQQAWDLEAIGFDTRLRKVITFSKTR